MQLAKHAQALDDTEAGPASGPTAQFITFTIGTEEYGVDIMSVREIKGWSDTTSLPNSPPYVRGVINLRGIIVPIFDLRARFGLGATETTKTHVVIIVAVQSRTIGILVDSVSDILTIASGDIRSVPDMDRSIDDAFLDGLVAVGERMVAIIALDRLFDLRGVPREREPHAATTAD
jgi:purine-binding chemotaxis protein CheW